MPNTRDIKKRINGVKSTQQITKAMKLVASSKVQKAKQRVEVNKFYFESLKESISNAVSTKERVDCKFIKNTEATGKKNVLYIVLSSDRGLCGGYNINLFKELSAHIDQEANNMFMVSGKKAKEFCKRKNYNVVYDMVGISENPEYTDAIDFCTKATDMFAKDEVCEIYLVYTQFNSIINQEQKVYKLLPVSMEEVKKEEKTSNFVSPLTIYEPSPEAVLNYVIPKYINSVIYGGMLEAAASEQGSRMTAMDNATTNADDILADLTLKYNRVRQSGITTEISEIVGGANALNA